MLRLNKICLNNEITKVLFKILNNLVNINEYNSLCWGAYMNRKILSVIQLLVAIGSLVLAVDKAITILVKESNG